MGTEMKSRYFGQGRAWLCEELLLKSVGVSRAAGGGSRPGGRERSRLGQLVQEKGQPQHFFFFFSLNILKNV